MERRSKSLSFALSSLCIIKKREWNILETEIAKIGPKQKGNMGTLFFFLNNNEDEKANASVVSASATFETRVKSRVCD
jgi:hypothetical protein